MKRLDEKVAIITGGGTGIGRGIALALAAEGAQVVVCGRRLDRLEQTVKEIQNLGGSARAVQADVALVEDIDRLVDAVLKDSWSDRYPGQ